MHHCDSSQAKTSQSSTYQSLAKCTIIYSISIPNLSVIRVQLRHVLAQTEEEDGSVEIVDVFLKCRLDIQVSFKLQVIESRTVNIFNIVISYVHYTTHTVNLKYIGAVCEMRYQDILCIARERMEQGYTVAVHLEPELHSLWDSKVIAFVYSIDSSGQG